MKKVGVYAIIGLIGVIVILLIYFGGSITGNVVKDTCTSPYIYVGGDCCLDKDNNKICDEDETPNSMIRAVDSKEECVIDRKLTCTWKRISANKIQIKLRNDQAGIFSPYSIEFSNVGKGGCKATFSGAVENGFDYQKDKQYDIECDFDENYINSLIVVKGMVYEKSKVRGPALTPYNTLEFATEGHINGFVE